MNNTKIIVAIDGFSSCGKSTLAKALAKKIGYIYIDTGAMYRAVALFALRNGFITNQLNSEALEKHLSEIHISFTLNPQTNLPEVCLNGENVEKEIRNLKVSSWVSPIAALPFVRQALVAMQQKMGEDKGVVLDGRDIGTRVFPQAELKIFVTATAEIRAQRRYDELQAKGETVNFEDIYQNVVERDRIDTTRAVDPLRKAPDAIELDNSSLTIAEQNQWLFNAFEKALAHANRNR